MWTFTIRDTKGSARSAVVRTWPGYDGFMEYRVAFMHETRQSRKILTRGGYDNRIVTFHTSVFVAVQGVTTIVTDDDIKEAHIRKQQEAGHRFVTVDKYTVLWERIRAAAPETWTIQEYVDKLLSLDNPADTGLKLAPMYASEKEIKTLFNIVLLPNPGFKENEGQWRRYLIYAASDKIPV